MALLRAARVVLGPKAPVRFPTARTLRIAMTIETATLGGAEVVMLQLAEELRRRGHTVFPITPEGREGWLRDRFVALGFEHHMYRWSRAVDWSCVEHMAGMLRELRADVFHGHEFTAAVYGAAAAQLAGIPNVISMHGNMWMTQALRRRVALRWAFAHSAATVAVSQDTRRHLEESLGLAPGVLTVVRNGVPDRPGDGRVVRRELGLGEGDLLVLAVGTLQERKGHRFLLEAMREVDRQGGVPAWKVAIAGEGVERPKLEAFIAEHGLQGRAVLLGSRDDVPDLQAAADIFVMPSLWEGLPLAILEAMFARNPIIATSASGIPEAISHGEEGLLIPPADVAALAGALRLLLSSPAERERLGTRARARAERDFSIGAMTEGYERLYRGEPSR